VNVAPSDRFDGIAGRDLAQMSDDIKVLDATFFVGVELTNPPVAFVVHFDEHGTVDMVMLADESGFLLDVVHLRDGAGREVELRAFTLHRRDGSHRHLRVRKDRRLPLAVRLQAFERIVRGGKDVHLAAPDESVCETQAFVEKCLWSFLSYQRWDLVGFLRATLHGQFAETVLVVRERADENLGVEVLARAMMLSHTGSLMKVLF
jgi:hypothetical protein